MIEHAAEPDRLHELLARMSGPMRDVLTWWARARAERLAAPPAEDAGAVLPAHAQLDPARFPKALPSIWLCDWYADQRSARMRLTGDDIARLFDRPLKGCWLDDLAGERTRPQILEIYRRVAETPCLYHSDGAIYRLSRELHGEGQRLILPLADDGRRVSHLLGVTEYGLTGRGPRAVNRVDIGPADAVREHYLGISEVTAVLA